MCVSVETPILWPLTCALEEPDGVLMKRKNVDVDPLKSFNHVHIASEQ
jgi:hypothetical protein